MKRTLRKSLAIILVAAILVCSAPLTGLTGIDLPDIGSLFAWAEEATSGNCGSNLTWKLDKTTGELEISGTGYMYSWDYSSAPWYSLRYFIKSVTIGNGVTNIGKYAFYDCSSLASITIPDSVTSIGYDAFYSCESLTSITIPDSVTSIGASAFSSCVGLTTVYYTGDIAGWCGIRFDGAYSNPMLYADNLYINGVSPEGNIVIPDGVTAIPACAFRNCDSITSITIPDSVTSIGDYAFCDCSSLASVTIPDSVTIIGSGVFYSCDSLASVTIPDSVTNIGDYAFCDCDNLASVIIPDGVISIGETVFSHFTQILCNKNSRAHDYALGNGYAYWLLDDESQEKTYSGKIGTKLTWSIDRKTRTMTIDNNGTMVSFSSETAPWIQYEKYIHSVKINYGCTNISDNAFCNCGYLESVEIPYSVTSIGDSAFSDCTSLASVTIPDSVTTIDRSAFSDCTSLANVTIPDSVTSIYYAAFQNCDSLASITIPDSLTSISNGVFSDCDSLASVTIPDNVTSIDGYAFQHCDSLASVTIGNGVTSIGEYAFYSCTSLASVTIGSGIKNIDYSAFAHCPNLADIYIHGKTCSINSNSITIYATIHGYVGSTAETFANKYGYDFVPIVDSPCAEHTFENSCDTVCNVCGFKREITHKFGEWEITKQPTCAVPGTKKHVCSVCGYSELDSVDMLAEHIYDNACDVSCNICGNTRETVHSYGEWSLIKEPTCDEFGMRERFCSLCRTKETDSVAKLTEHTYTDSCDTECNVCGKTRDINHTFSDWSLIKEPTCDEYGEKERSCSVCGLVEKDSVAKLGEHAYTDSCDTECNICGEIRKINHTYGEWIIIQAPVCNVIGIKNRVCSVCGYSETGSIEKTEHTFDSICDDECNVCGEIRIASHSYGKWTVTKEPTCNAFGEKERVCAICNNTETETIDKPEHAYTDSCDEKCDICGEARVTAHSFGEWFSIKEPTCGSLGIKERTCSVCGYKQSDYVSVTNEHTYTNGCDAECDVCGATRTVSHKFGEWKITKEPTCNSFGEKERVCSVGGCVETEIVFNIPHTDEDKNGICEVCGKQFEMNFLMNGVCGENLVWSIDDDGVLTISGSGKMYNFGNGDYISINPETKEHVPDGAKGSIRICRWNTHYDKIRKVIIGDSVESLSVNAFKGCYNLENVNVPDVVINIEPSAFEGCGKATIVCKNGSYAHVYAVQNGMNYILENSEAETAFRIKNAMLIGYNGTAQNIVLPSEITAVGIDAFNGNNTVKSIEIPYSVSKIHDGAFADCKNLKSVVIPFTATEIGASAFEGTNAKIYCYNNSYAHKYAVKNGLDYELITVTLTTNSVSLTEGETFALQAVPSITLASGVPFAWKSSDANIVSVDENGNMSANINGEATVSVLAPNGTTLASCSVTVVPDEYTVTWVVDGKTTEQIYRAGDVIVVPVSPEKTGYKFIGWTPEVPSVMPKYDVTFTAVFESSGPVNADIIKRPSQSTIKYGDSIILHVNASMIPEGGRVEWTVSGDSFSCKTNGETCTITPSKSGDTTFTAIIYDAEGNPVLKDEQTMTSKAGFFDKIIAFFKGIFGLNKTYPNVFKGIF